MPEEGEAPSSGTSIPGNFVGEAHSYTLAMDVRRSEHSLSYVAVIGCVVIALLGGCTVYRTPDGHSFLSVTGTQVVRDKLGEPDMIGEEERFVWGPYQRTLYTYLDRGYNVDFIDGRVCAVTLIAENERADWEQRVRVYKEEVPKISLGQSGADVLKSIGPPDQIFVSHQEDGAWYRDYDGPYNGQFELSPPAEEIVAHWRSNGLFVLLEKGRVTKVRPLVQWDLDHAKRDEAAEAGANAWRGRLDLDRR